MLICDQVFLTTVSQKNLEQLRTWRNSDHVRKFQYNSALISELEHKCWFEKNNPNQFLFEIHKIIDKPPEETLSDSQFIGYCALLHINWIDRVTDFGIYLDPTQTGQGYATMAMKALINHAFNDLNLHKMTSHVFLTNKKALNLYSKLHFQQEGTLKQHHYLNGDYIDVAVVGLLKHDYVVITSPEVQ